MQKSTEGTEETRAGIGLAQGSGQSNTGAVIRPTCKSHHRALVQPRPRGRLAGVGWGGVGGSCLL